MGVVVLATQYDPYDRAFSNKAQMENSYHSNASNPFRSFSHVLKTNQKDTPYKFYYVNSPSNTSGGDLRLYDFAATTIATVGMQSSSGTVGELWVEYDVEFLKPRAATTPLLVYTDSLREDFSVACESLSGFTYQDASNLGTQIVMASSGQYGFSFPANGSYLIINSMLGDAPDDTKSFGLYTYEGDITPNYVFYGGAAWNMYNPDVLSLSSVLAVNVNDTNSILVYNSIYIPAGYVASILIVPMSPTIVGLAHAFVGHQTGKSSLNSIPWKSTPPTKPPTKPVKPRLANLDHPMNGYVPTGALDHAPQQRVGSVRPRAPLQVNNKARNRSPSREST